MSKEDLIPAKKGEVRNKKGRPGVKNWSTLFRKYAKTKIKPSSIDVDMPDEKYFEKNMTIQDIIVIRLLYKAMKKTDARDIEMIINRMDGLLKQSIDIESSNLNTNIDYSDLTEDEAKELFKKKQQEINNG